MNDYIIYDMATRIFHKTFDLCRGSNKTLHDHSANFRCNLSIRKQRNNFSQWGLRFFRHWFSLSTLGMISYLAILS
ncbi:hypothetical protein CCR91_17590 [Thiorhodovibrio winogradskyi]|nr:hypothetical protein [Thiorhodovibrio winogradskyi]